MVSYLFGLISFLCIIEYCSNSHACHKRINIYRRSIERSIRENLRAILNVDLPKRDNDSAANSEFSSECGICYTYSIPSSITTGNDHVPRESKDRSQFPDQICPNPRCSKIYHHVCILDWLQSLTSSKISFGKMFGQCPYCNESITIECLR